MDTACVFCGIVWGKVEADVIYRDAWVTAFRDIAPKAPCHVLIVPNRHVRDLAELGADGQELLGALLWAARTIVESEGLARQGYRLVINAGIDGGQSVDHMHLHILGGRRLDWPPG